MADIVNGREVARADQRGGEVGHEPVSAREGVVFVPGVHDWREGAVDDAVGGADDGGCRLLAV